MGVVDPEHAPSTRIVERQRVADAVRPDRIGRHALCQDLDPEATADLSAKAVEIEKPVETLVAPARAINVSDNDNYIYRRVSRHDRAALTHRYRRVPVSASLSARSFARAASSYACAFARAGRRPLKY